MRSLVFLAPLLVGCVSNSEDGGILVIEAVAPQTGCTIMAQAGEPGITHGALSSLFPTEYVLTAQMESRITATMGHEADRTVILTGANVDLTFPNSTLFTSAQLSDMKSKGITHFKSLFSAPLMPNNALTDASFSITPKALYQQIYMAAPQAMMPATNDPASAFDLEILATVTVVGTMSGSEVKSQPFQFPVGISNGNGVVQIIAGGCPVPASSTVLTGNACGLAQDAAITCCDANGQLVCPAPIANPTP